MKPSERILVIANTRGGEGVDVYISSIIQYLDEEWEKNKKLQAEK